MDADRGKALHPGEPERTGVMLGLAYPPGHTTHGVRLGQAAGNDGGGVKPPVGLPSDRRQAVAGAQSGHPLDPRPP